MHAFIIKSLSLHEKCKFSDLLLYARNNQNMNLLGMTSIDKVVYRLDEILPHGKDGDGNLIYTYSGAQF